jgi:glycosyltransferase involved in cell wall biosynthesis
VKRPICQVYFPYGRDPRAGGPSGFISQNFAEAPPDGYAITPDLTELPRNPFPTLISAARQGASLTRVVPRGRHDARRRQKFFLSGAHRADTLWFHDSGTFGDVADLVSPQQGVIYQPHTPVKPWEEIEDREQREKREATTLALFERADHVVLPSRHCVEIFEALITPSKLVIIESACAAPDSFAPIPLDPGATYFLFIGRRNHIKGFDIAIEGFRLAHEKSSKLRLLLIGQGPKVSAPGVIDLGPQQRVHDWIASVDCVVNTNRQSYFDLSVMEALAVGRPLIFTMTGGHKDLAGAAQRLEAIAPTAPALTDAMLRFTGEARPPSCEDELRALYQASYSLPSYRERLRRALPLLSARAR